MDTDKWVVFILDRARRAISFYIHCTDIRVIIFLSNSAKETSRTESKFPSCIEIHPVGLHTINCISSQVQSLGLGCVSVYILTFIQ